MIWRKGRDKYKGICYLEKNKEREGGAFKDKGRKTKGRKGKMERG